MSDNSRWAHFGHLFTAHGALRASDFDASDASAICTGWNDNVPQMKVLSDSVFDQLISRASEFRPL